MPDSRVTMPTRRATLRALRRLCIALLLNALPAAATEPFTARFELTRNDKPIGELVQQLANAPDGTLLYTSRTTPKGVLAWLLSGTVEERTVLERADGRLRPLRYRHERRGIGPDRTVEIAFDWARQRVRNVIDGDPWLMQTPPDTLDKHALLLVVTEDLYAGSLREAYAVADGGTLKHYRFLRAGTAQVVTPAGRFDTVLLQRRRGDKTTGTDFWHAPRLDYLPVRIERVAANGDRYLLLLQSIELEERP